tara:strand:+ start:502 stop:723 length:222 start_codon:yes stop_codon:yes gene_type:complete
MARKIIKSDWVTTEQYDKLQVDVVNKIEELEQTVEKLTERQEAQENHTRTLAALWALTTLFAIVSTLILAVSG